MVDGIQQPHEAFLRLAHVAVPTATQPSYVQLGFGSKYNSNRVPNGPFHLDLMLISLPLEQRGR